MAETQEYQDVEKVTPHTEKKFTEQDLTVNYAESVMSGGVIVMLIITLALGIGSGFTIWLSLDYLFPKSVGEHPAVFVMTTMILTVVVSLVHWAKLSYNQKAEPYKKELQQVYDDLQHFKEMSDELFETKGNYEGQLGKAKTIVGDLKSKIEVLEKENKATKAELQAKIAKSYEERIEGLNTELAKLRQELVKNNESYDSALRVQKHYKELVKEKEIWVDMKLKMDAMIERLNHDNQGYDEQVCVLKAENEVLQNSLNEAGDLAEVIKEKEEQITELNHKVVELEGTLAEKVKYQEAHDELSFFLEQGKNTKKRLLKENGFADSNLKGLFNWFQKILAGKDSAYLKLKRSSADLKST